MVLQGGLIFFSTEKDRKNTEMLLITYLYSMAYETLNGLWGKIESNAFF